MPHEAPPIHKDNANNIDLNRRHAVITGVAQGIGLAISRRILASGASVSLWDHDVRLLASVSAQLSDKGSISVEGVDVADRESVARATEAIVAKHGSIDILVVNAGICQPESQNMGIPHRSVEAGDRDQLVRCVSLLSCHRSPNGTEELRTKR